MATISDLANAIQTFEGWAPGTRSYRNNNPGNIYGNYAGAIGTDAQGFAIFPSYSDGLAALEQVITHYVNSGATLTSMMNKYAPPGPGTYGKGSSAMTASNDTPNYISGLASMLGIDPSATLANVLGSGSSENVSTPPSTNEFSSLVPSFDFSGMTNDLSSTLEGAIGGMDFSDPSVQILLALTASVLVVSLV